MLENLDIVVINQPAARGGSNRQLFDSLSHHWRQCEKLKIRQGGQE